MTIVALLPAISTVVGIATWCVWRLAVNPRYHCPPPRTPLRDDTRPPLLNLVRLIPWLWALPGALLAAGLILLVTPQDRINTQVGWLHDHEWWMRRWIR